MSYNAKKDFIIRTIEILNQYDEYTEMKELPESKRYQETLFLNCLMGLLVIIRRDYLNGFVGRLSTRAVTTIEGTEILLSEDTIRELRDELNHTKVELKDEDMDRKIDAIFFPRKGTIRLADLKPVIEAIAMEVHAAIPD